MKTKSLFYLSILTLFIGNISYAQGGSPVGFEEYVKTTPDIPLEEKEEILLKHRQETTKMKSENLSLENMNEQLLKLVKDSENNLYVPLDFSLSNTLENDLNIDNENSLKLNDIDEKYISVEDNLNPEFDINALKGRKFPNQDLTAYSSKLDNLIGVLIKVDDNQNIISIGRKSYVTEPDKIQSETIKNQKWVEKIYDKNNDSSINWLFFSYTVKNTEKISFHIADTDRAYLPTSGEAINEDKLKKFFLSIPKDQHKYYKMIRTATVTEVVSKKFKKVNKNTKVKELPIFSQVLNVGNDYYQSVTDNKKDIYIGLTLTDPWM